MCNQKAFLFVAITLAMASVANAGLVLTVNGLDTSMPIEVKADDDIIIAVAGQTDEQKKSYSVICEMGGKLEPLPESNTLAEKPKEGDYLFTFEDEKLGLAMINLTVGDILDYQLILFKIPDANTIIFGIDSDAIEIPEPEPEPESETEPIDLQSPYDYNNVVPYAQRKEAEKEKSLKFCPTGVDLITVTGALPAKENKGREIVFDNGRSGGIMTMGTSSVIDVNSDITSNQIWTADNTYHVVADVNVQALLVVEPGTVVTFAPDKSMLVNNGGTLISVGTPDNPIIYTSDSGTPGYADYYCPMYIEETASVNTKIMYSYVEYAYVGLLILNNDLETDIQHNYFYNNAYGIVEYGINHTDIRSNLVVASYYSGIEVFMADASGQASSDSLILIENNTCDNYQDNGITVHGVNDVNEAGVVVLTNNIVFGSYQYGLALVDYYMYATVTNTGYFDNANNKNWEFEEENPAFETVSPYEMGTGTLPACYLRQDCNFVNAGSFLIEQTPLIGQTTDVNGIPDCNYVDIGFHYPNWNFSNPGSGDSLSADFDDSMKVDFRDFATFANYWQQSTSGDADLDGSGFVDYNDLSIFTSQWLQIADPNIEIHISGDSNDGYVDVSVSGFTSSTLRVFLLVDGQYINEILWFKDGETFELDISALSTGTHQLKAVSISTTGRVTCSNLTESIFNCFLQYCLCADAYDSNEPHYFSAYYPGTENVSVKVYDEENNLVWSQTYPGESLNGFIPTEITLADDLDSIVFEETSAGRAGAAAAGTSVKKPLGLKFRPQKVPADIRALIIVPSWWMRNFGDYGVIQAVKGTFETRNVPYRYLKGSQASYKVLAWYGANRNIEYIYYCGHSGYKPDKYSNVLRTTISLSDGKTVSVKQSDFAPGQAPSWCEKLPGNLEKTANSMFLTGFSQGELKFVHFDGCSTGHLKLTGDNRLIEGPGGSQGLLAYYHNDMSWALKMQSSSTQIYQGWWGDFKKGETSKFNIFAYHEWTKLGEGDNLYNALMYAIDQTPWVPDGPHDNFRLMGQGDLPTLG